MVIKDLYNKFSIVLVYLLPLVLFLPQQYYKNLFLSIPFWTVILFALFLLPEAYSQISRAFLRTRNSSTKVILAIFSAYLIVLALACLTSMNVWVSLSVLFLHFAYFVIFFAAAKVLPTHQEKQLFAMVLLTIIIMLSILSFYNSVIKRYVNLTSEGLSFMWTYYGHNHLAVLLLISIPLALFFIYRYYKFKTLRFMLLLVLLFQLYSLLLTFSRGASIALSLTLLFGGIWLGIKYRDRLSKKAQVSMMGLLVIILLVASVTFLRKFPSGMESRIFHWQKGIEIFLKNPVLGSGPGTYRVISKYNKDFRFAESDYPLNLIVQQASDTGVLGLITGLLLYGAILFKCLQILRQPKFKQEHVFNMAIGLGLIGILLNEMVDFDMQLPALGSIFFLLSGLLNSENA